MRWMIRSGPASPGSVWTAAAKPDFDEPVERPIGERPSHREHSSDRSLGRECFGDRESVGGVFGEDSEDGVLG